MDVASVDSGRDRRAFLELPYQLRGDDPSWIAPLRISERARWTPRRNASLGRLSAQRFLARARGQVVGRIAIAVDPRFQRWSPATGFFGFLDSVRDPTVVGALLETAEEALRRRGCGRVVGPVHLTTHEEVGFLVEGFQPPLPLLSPTNPSWLPEMVASFGYTPVKSYGAFRWSPSSSPSPAMRRIARRVDTRRGRDRDFTFRSLDPERFEGEVATLRSLYNAAFRDVWGFVELDEAEFRERANDFRQFYRPDLIALAFRGPEPVAFAVILPDVNQALAGLGGRLLLFGWLRLAHRLKAVVRGRFILMGVLPEARGHAVSAALALYLRERVLEAGLEQVEVSLVQEDNRTMMRVVEALGCTPLRRYQLLGKDLRNGRHPRDA